jgi:hypothetical protein
LAVAEEWRVAEELLASRRAHLLSNPGVVGVGLGFRVKGGKETDEPCITVFVRQKLGPAELADRNQRPLRTRLRSPGGSIPVDVVQIGRLDRFLRPGDSIGPEDKQERGTFGAFAVDLVSGAPVAITAMHATGYVEYPPGSSPQVPFCEPSRLDDPNGTRIGTLGRGTTSGVDAARIELVDDAKPSPGTVTARGWRPTVYPDDRGTLVRFVGSTSGEQAGYICFPSVSLPAENLDAAILARIDAREGDSGAALLDNAGLVLGFLVGRATGSYANLVAFTPASLVLARLGCDIPTV